ncbi:MAG: hypothetical protein R3E82_13825 [Pseudomonadales bacterium]|nr:hypothetical protein [Pseudomonadales bacterium]
MIAIITLIILASVLLCGYVAKARGLSLPRWIAISLLFGPLAIPFVYLVRAGNEGEGGSGGASE